MSSTQQRNITLNKCLAIVFSIIFFEFLIMGVSLGTLPEYVHRNLGYNNITVGLVIGLQYLATLLTRHLAGESADTKGGQITVSIGLGLSALSGFFCLLSLWFNSYHLSSLVLLLIGRILLGIGESYLVIGIFAWGFRLVGQKNTGKVMVWNGLGMHGGMALGAPLGILLQTKMGLSISFAAIMLLPLISFLITNLLPKISMQDLEKRLPFYKAIKLVWRAGSGLALASIGFSGIASFITLYFLQRGWADASLALSAFGAGYIVMRLFFAHFPDKFGGARVAIFCLTIEAAGQLLIWQAPNGIFAMVGAILTGCGMSLVFPSFGQLAIKKVSADNRGMAMAAYNAFFDLGMGVTAPIAGLIAGGVHYEYIYLLGGIAAIIGMVLATREFFNDKAAVVIANL
ncbi:MFS transporter [Mucilaginibacter sp. PAMB04274]|uniref:MFS transporter n=1 Tax=Mucilaginibacter sp. PAMB04274 TaxID=3138568 RepID=UPI0031F6C6FF